MEKEDRDFINALLDRVQWTALPPPAEIEDEIPYATHGGLLTMAGFTFRVYQLNTGKRIFHADDIDRFLREGE